MSRFSLVISALFSSSLLAQPIDERQLLQVVNQIVFQQQSLYRNLLIAEGQGLRCIRFGRYHTYQTCIDTAQPERLVFAYTRALFAGLYAAPHAQRVLVLGLGGGVMPRALRAVNPALHIDSVELDPAVLKVAKSHFGYQPDAQSIAHVSDARVFVRQQRRTKTRYDLILIDCFEQDYIPEHLLTLEFLQEVRQLLTDTGVVAANTFSGGTLEQHETATYQAVFGQTYQLDLDTTNRIILAGRAPLPSLTALGLEAQRWDERLAFLGVDSAELLPRLRVQSPSTAQPFTDQFSPANLLRE